jgi:hypothetical protein
MLDINYIMKLENSLIYNLYLDIINYYKLSFFKNLFKIEFNNDKFNIVISYIKNLKLFLIIYYNIKNNLIILQFNNNNYIKFDYKNKYETIYIIYKETNNFIDSVKLL